MHPDWRSVLLRGGARIADGVVFDFGDERSELFAATAHNAMADLSQLAIIEVTGEDATTFLGGQLSSDINSLPLDRSSLSAWCSPQGRVLALFRVHRTAGSFFLLLPRELLETTIKRLRMYVLRSRATLIDRSEELVRMGLCGDNAMKKLGDLAATPAQVDGVASSERGVVVRLPGPRPRCLIVCQPDVAATLWDAMGTACRPVGQRAWDLLDIDAGLPQVFNATREKFLPQMLNLDALGGVSFEKGCYPGQEIIARLKYRGQLKQRLYVGQSDMTELPDPGTRLAIESSDVNAGEVLQAGPRPEGGVALTAVVQIELVGKERIHLRDKHGPVVRFSSPPYWTD
jgi:folate-binding protein YgfZ